MNYLSKQTNMPRQLQSPLIFTFLIIALVGCFIPWIVVPVGGLQMGAYDLAEWSSLVPAVRQAAPFMWPALALRLPLAFVGVLFSLYTAQNHRGWAVTIAIVTAIALLPPLEFFTIYRDDANYRQQFIIAVGTLIIGIMGIGLRDQNKQMTLIVIVCLLGCIASVVGLGQAYTLMGSFSLHPTLGLGGGMTILGLAIIAAVVIKQSRTQPTLF